MTGRLRIAAAAGRLAMHEILPGHACRTEIDHDRRQQGNGARWKGSGVAASSAPKLLVSKTTTDAAAACTNDLLMVTTLPPSWLDHLPCVPRRRMRRWVRGAPVSRLPKSSTLATTAPSPLSAARPQTDSAGATSMRTRRAWTKNGHQRCSSRGKQRCAHA